MTKFLGVQLLFAAIPFANGDDGRSPKHVSSSHSVNINARGGGILQLKQAMRRETLELETGRVVVAVGPADAAKPKEADTQTAAPTVAQQNYDHDWLYGFSKTACGEGLWDNTQYSLTSRVFLPVLFAALILAIIIIGHLGDDGSDTERAQLVRSDSEPTQRRFDLDYARILCIACVVSEHSGGWHWSVHNVFFLLEWVLPFLYLTSGISFMMSQKPLPLYAARLVAVFLVGVFANWSADVITGRQWRADFGNTIFQMFYVVMLILMSIIAGPLRSSLLWRKTHADEKADWKQWAPVVITGLVTGVGFGFFVAGIGFLPPDPTFLPKSNLHADATEILRSGPIVLIQVVGILFLSHLACLFRATGILPWLLLVHIYLPRVLIPWAGVGFPHNLELFVFAMVADAWKLKGHRNFASTVQGYWPIFIFFLLLLSCADMEGRCDLVPASSTWERLRFYGIEMTFGLCLTTEAFKVGDPFKCGAAKWLGYWALYAYCFHVAWARLFPQPYGAVFTYTSAVFFYFWAKYNDTAKSIQKGDKKASPLPVDS